MDIFFSSFEFTILLVSKMGSIMFITLFGIELFMQLGLMKYLKPLGEPVAKLANLPSESALSFLAAIGSMIAAHTMSAQFHADKKISDKELILTGILNTVPFHFKETLTFQLPVVLPLLGIRLCLIYIAVFWLTGILKLSFVIFWGHLFLPKTQKSNDAFELNECNSDCSPRTFSQLLKNSWYTRKKMFIRMIFILASITFIIQILINSGLLQLFEKIIVPITSVFHLPSQVIGPISAYIFSPTVGITYMSNLLNHNIVSQYQAIVSLLVGGLLMIPVTRLRRTLPRYTAIYGVKKGSIICGLTTFFSMFARILILIWVIIFFDL